MQAETGIEEVQEVPVVSVRGTLNRPYKVLIELAR